MIREQQNWTPSELIYLFVDGEADDVQKSLLFSALANDAGLQAEFSDALHIGAAIKEAGREARPPQHVTAALFEKAGFGLAAEETSAAAGAAVVLAGESTSLTSGLRGLVLPLLSAFVGGIIALLFAPEILRQPGTPGQQVLAAHEQVATTSPTAPSLSQKDAGDRVSDLGGNTNTGTNRKGRVHEQMGKGRPELSGFTNSGRKEERIEGRDRLHGNGPTAEDEAIGAAVNEVQDGMLAEDITATANGGQRAENNGTDAAVHTVEDGLVPLKSVLPTDSPDNVTPTLTSRIREITVPATPLPAVSIPEATATPQRSEGNDQSLALLESAVADHSAALDVEEARFVLQARGMADLELYPKRSLSTGKQTMFQNIAITGFYNISRSHSVGIEVGREYHPLYVPTTAGSTVSITDPNANTGGGIGIILNGTGTTPGNTNNTLIGTGNNGRTQFVGTTNSSTTNETQSATGFRLEPQTAWLGLAYQFRAGALDRLGLIRPYAQAMVGGTEIGPIGKGSLGISWTPDSRVSFNVGVEGTTILYRNDGAWYSSRKLGLAYSAQINF